MWSIFRPHILVDSVVDLTPELLRRFGVENLLLDVDCTLKKYVNQEPEPDVCEWLEVIKNEGFRVCLLSNGVEKRIKTFATLVDLPYIAKACKPLTRGCRRAFVELKFVPAKTILVGDQIFADVMAGRLAGMRTVLVTPIAPEQEHWFTRIKRPFERLLLNSYKRNTLVNKTLKKIDKECER